MRDLVNTQAEQQGVNITIEQNGVRDAKLYGDTTKGSSGRPMPHQLGNGVTVYLSSWEDQLPDGTILEGRGVRPDIVIKTTLRMLEQSDPVLEAALKALRRPAPKPKTPAS